MDIPEEETAKRTKKPTWRDNGWLFLFKFDENINLHTPKAHKPPSKIKRFICGHILKATREKVSFTKIQRGLSMIISCLIIRNHGCQKAGYNIFKMVIEERKSMKNEISNKTILQNKMEKWIHSQVNTQISWLIDQPYKI